MHKQVTRQTRPVIHPATPARPMDGVKGSARCLAEPGIPIDRPRRGIGRYRVLPCPVGAVASLAGLDQGQPAQSAGSDNLLRLRIDHRADSLAADLHDPFVLFRNGNHLGTLFGDVAHRLFAINILAGLAAGLHQPSVPVVRCGHDYRIQTRASQKLPVIPCGENVVTCDFGGQPQTPCVEVGCADTFHPGQP